MPPSGPTTITISPRPGTGRSASGPEAASCEHDRHDASRSSCDDLVGGDDVGDLGEPRAPRLLGGLAGGGPPPRERLAGPSPRQTATDRDAAHGTITSTPISVSISTASSPRSPLGSAWTTTTRGIGRRARRRRRRPRGQPSLRRSRPRHLAPGRRRRSARPARRPGSGVPRPRGAPRRPRPRQRRPARRRPATRPVDAATRACSVGAEGVAEPAEDATSACGVRPSGAPRRGWRRARAAAPPAASSSRVGVSTTT